MKRELFRTNNVQNIILEYQDFGEKSQNTALIVPAVFFLREKIHFMTEKYIYLTILSIRL